MLVGITFIVCCLLLLVISYYMWILLGSSLAALPLRIHLPDIVSAMIPSPNFLCCFLKNYLKSDTFPLLWNSFNKKGSSVHLVPVCSTYCCLTTFLLLLFSVHKVWCVCYIGCLPQEHDPGHHDFEFGELRLWGGGVKADKLFLVSFMIALLHCCTVFFWLFMWWFCFRLWF